MGFSKDPGPLPFITVRPKEKWAPRLAGQSFVEMQVDFGDFTLPPKAKIAKVEPYTGKVPQHLASLYKGRALIAIHLEPM